MDESVTHCAGQVSVQFLSGYRPIFNLSHRNTLTEQRASNDGVILEIEGDKYLEGLFTIEVFKYDRQEMTMQKDQATRGNGHICPIGHI